MMTSDTHSKEEEEQNNKAANDSLIECNTSEASRKETSSPVDIRVNSMPPETPPDVDVIIVGGGPAGLSAALILGRANRSVLIFDSAEQRNSVSETQHAILGADGENRAQFLVRAREQVLAYPTVQFVEKTVVDIDIEAARTRGTTKTKLRNHEIVTKTWNFEAFTEDYMSYRSKKLILATGVRDLMPNIEGFDTFWGRGIFVCLFCDCYEYNGGVLGAYGNGKRGVHIAFEMLLWSPNVILFTNGQPLEATEHERKLLKQKNIKVIETPISRAYGNEEKEDEDSNNSVEKYDDKKSSIPEVSKKKDHLAGLELSDGTRIPLDALFYNTGRFQSSTIPDKIGLTADSRGDLVCEERGNVKCVHGLYAAGNCSKAPLKLVITAASQGAVTGAKINSELMYEELGLADGTDGGVISEEKKKESLKSWLWPSWRWLGYSSS
jgi:thioredoxin reductase